MSAAIPRGYLKPEWLRADDAAALLGMSTRTLKRRADAGLIGYSQESRTATRYYRRDEIEAYRERHYRGPRTVPFPRERA
jgi:predicted site-specific integrase-resolvase